MTSLDVRLADVLGRLSDCLCDRLAKVGAGPTCFCGVLPGDSAAWDYCGACDGASCGMGYVIVRQVYPTAVFPIQREWSPCDSPMAVALSVGALRCIPMPSDTGDLPSEGEMLESTLAVLADMAAMQQAILCCGFRDVSLGEYVSLGPAGGCAGGEWSVVVGL